MSHDQETPALAHTTYRPASGIQWVVETYSLILADGKGTTQRVAYPEAAVWDLMSRGYRIDKIVPMMCHIASLEAGAAGQLVADALEGWAASGFLTKETPHG